jgi:hypothetical protein
MLLIRGLLVYFLAMVAVGVSAYFAYYQPHQPAWVLLLVSPLVFGLLACIISPSWLTPAVFTAVYYGMERLIVATAIKPLGISVTQRYLDGDRSALLFPVGVAAFCWIALVAYRQITGYGRRTSDPLKGSHLIIILTGLGLIASVGLMIGSPNPIVGLILFLLIAAPLLYWWSWQKPAPPVKPSCYYLIVPAAIFWVMSSFWILLLTLDEVRYTARDDRVVAAAALFALQVLMVDRLRRQHRLLAGWSIGLAAGMIVGVVAGRYGWPAERSWLAEAGGKKAYTVATIGYVIGPLLGLGPAWYWRTLARRAQPADDATQPQS